MRDSTFGGHLDGIDWDWEGFCSITCLKDKCDCGWSDKECGDKSPEELIAGVRYKVKSHAPDGEDYEKECFTLPNRATVQVMTGITHHMKQAGFVVTAAPMSTAVYTSEPDNSEK